ncbi:hypothetical protein AVEN_132498-1, partial [Araneus ventricosus]
MFGTLFQAQLVLPNSTVPLQLKDIEGKGRESLRSVTTHARRRNSVLERSSVPLYFKLLSPLGIIFGREKVGGAAVPQSLCTSRPWSRSEATRGLFSDGPGNFEQRSDDENGMTLHYATSCIFTLIWHMKPPAIQLEDQSVL